MSIVYLLLGSNQGDRIEILANAKKMIEERIGLVTRSSLFYESEAWGFVSDNFINQVLCVQSELSPHQILHTIHQIESEAGRVRKSTNGYEARSLDIDILFYNNLVLATSNLTIPHPQLHKRCFTLMPLNEIAPDLFHPVLALTIKQLLQQCTDVTKVWLYKHF